MSQTIDELLEGAPDRPQMNETLDFNEYLNELYDDPKIERNAYQRLVDSLEYWGVEEDPEHGRNLYKLFTDDPVNDGQDIFFGENIHGRGGEDGGGIDKLADKLYNAAEKKGAHKRLLLMLGPVGAGKTDASKKLVEGFEEYTKTDDGRMYSFRWTDLDSDKVPGQHPDDREIEAPMQQSPLLLLPGEKRDEVVSGLNEELDASYALDLDQNLTPESEFYRDQLVQHYMEESDEEMTEYEALQEVLDNHVEVTPLIADENKGQAVATFEPKKPKNQDEKDLTGGTDLSRVGNYGEGDPRAFEYAGALNKANRGIFSGEELLKLDTEFLYNFLEATEDSTIKPKGQPLMDLDTVILGRTNMAEFKDKQGTEEMEAFNSRMNRIDFPYVIEYGEEAKIYEKFIENSDGDVALADDQFDPEEHEVNIEPHTLDMASMFSVATRLEDQRRGTVSDLLEKVKAYNGDLDDVDVKQLREAGEEDSEHGEGMKGITTRYIEDQLFAAMRDSEKRGEEHVSPLKVLSYLENNLEENASILDSDYDELQGLIGDIREEEFKERAVEDVRQAMAYDEDELERMAGKYLKHANAYVRGKDEVEGDSSSLTDKQEVDERFLTEIEEQLDFRSDNVEDFRQEIDSWISGRTLEGEDIDPLENNRLREAVQSKLWADKKNNINFQALVNESETLEDDTKNATVDALNELGYSEDGAEELLEYVGSEVAKSELEEL